MPRRVKIGPSPDSAPEVIKETVSETVVVEPPIGEVEVPVQDDTDAIKKSETDQELLRHSSRGSMATFVAFPQKIHFIGQGENEEVILLVRAHWITNVVWVLTVVVLAILPTIVVPAISVFGIGAGFSGYVILSLVGWYLAIFSYGFLKYLYWFFNVGIVTAERVIDIDWHNLTKNETSVAQINKIEDAKAVSVGVLSSFFDFGNVYVQTAGTEPNVEFLFAPHSRLIAKKIQELMQKEEEQHETKP
jgi:hypothetical protein